MPLMQRLFLILTLYSLIGLVLPAPALRAQFSQRPANEADKAYYDGRYQDAEASYRQELEKGYEPRLQFNLGDALHGQGKYEEAMAEFKDASATAKNERLRSGAYFNLGNTWMELDSIDAAIAAYKNAIRSNPEDPEARYNLAVVQRMKEQHMQNQEQEQQEQQEQNEQEQQKQEQKEQQSGENQQSSSPDQQQEGEQQSPPESSPGEDQQSSGQSKPEEQESQKQRAQSGQPQRPGVTQQEARRLLRIMEEEEQKTIERQRQRSAPARKPEKDW